MTFIIGTFSLYSSYPAAYPTAVAGKNYPPPATGTLRILGKENVRDTPFKKLTRKNQVFYINQPLNSGTALFKFSKNHFLN